MLLVFGFINIVSFIKWINKKLRSTRSHSQVKSVGLQGYFCGSTWVRVIVLKSDGVSANFVLAYWTDIETPLVLVFCYPVYASSCNDLLDAEGVADRLQRWERFNCHQLVRMALRDWVCAWNSFCSTILSAHYAERAKTYFLGPCRSLTLIHITKICRESNVPALQVAPDLFTISEVRFTCSILERFFFAALS